MAPDPRAIDLRAAGQLPERCLQRRNAVVVEVPGHPAHEHARHAHGPVAALEQINAERGIALGGELASDVADVVIIVNPQNESLPHCS
jgi:hypothetical protein